MTKKVLKNTKKLITKKPIKIQLSNILHLKVFFSIRQSKNLKYMVFGSLLYFNGHKNVYNNYFLSIQFIYKSKNLVF